MATDSTNNPTSYAHVFMFMLLHSHLHRMHTLHTEPAVAQHIQADSPLHLSGAAPKEKLNSFNRGRAEWPVDFSMCVHFLAINPTVHLAQNTPVILTMQLEETQHPHFFL